MLPGCVTALSFPLGLQFSWTPTRGPAVFTETICVPSARQVRQNWKLRSRMKPMASMYEGRRRLLHFTSYQVDIISLGAHLGCIQERKNVVKSLLRS